MIMVIVAKKHSFIILGWLFSSFNDKQNPAALMLISFIHHEMALSNRKKKIIIISQFQPSTLNRIQSSAFNTHLL